MTHRLIATTADDLEPDSRYRALIFDWDGTLVDSRRANHEAFSAALRPYGLRIDDQWYGTRTGLSTVDLVAEASASFAMDLDADAVMAARNRAFLERIASVDILAAAP